MEKSSELPRETWKRIQRSRRPLFTRLRKATAFAWKAFWMEMKI